MILLLRRKHQITRPSIRREGTAYKTAGFTLLLLLVVAQLSPVQAEGPALVAADGSQWRRPGSAAPAAVRPKSATTAKESSAAPASQGKLKWRAARPGSKQTASRSAATSAPPKAHTASPIATQPAAGPIRQVAAQDDLENDPFGDDPQPVPGSNESRDKNPPASKEPNNFETMPEPDMPGSLPGSSIQPVPVPSDDARLQAEIEQSLSECEMDLQKLKNNRLTTWDKSKLGIQVTGMVGLDYPVECVFAKEEFSGRHWAELTYTWKASALCHKPLYFEDEHLERYGHEWGPYLQPFVSGAHFFATIPLLPYKMGLEPPNECIYVLGHYRPGNCAPYLIDPIPFSWRAALFEAGAWVGGVAIVP